MIDTDLLDEFHESYFKDCTYQYKKSFGKNKSNCRLVCETKLKGVKGIGIKSPYENGFVYCRRCDFYFKVRNKYIQYCECCGMKLRRKRKNRPYKL